MTLFLLNELVWAEDVWWVMSGMYAFAVSVLFVLMLAVGCVRIPILFRQVPGAGTVKLPNRTENPQISVIMPCKGVHDSSITNWRAQLSSQYAPLEFVFCVESAEDPAYAALNELKKEYPDLQIKVVYPGLSWHCGQKIANLLQGLAESSPDSEFVLFLDDDVSLHPNTITTLVNDMVGPDGDKVFCVSGYSFEVPAHGCSVWMYIVFLFRILNLPAFTTETPAHIWGGCMLMRRADFWTNRYNIVDHWRDGGYSDDNIINAVATQMGHRMVVRRTSIFPNRLSQDRGSFGYYWNFLKRQLYALNSYSSEYCRVHNHRLLLCLFMIGATFLVSEVFVLLHTLSLVAALLYPAEATHLWENPSWRLAAICDVWSWTVFISLFGVLQFDVSVLARVCNHLVGEAGLEKPITPRINWAKCMLAFIIHTFWLPVGCINVYFRSYITWSGTKYLFTNGRVSKVLRKNSDGELYEGVSWGESLAHMVQRHQALNFPCKESYAEVELEEAKER